MSPHSTVLEFEKSDADRMRPVLTDAADVVRRRIDLRWACGWKSEAAGDLAVTRDLVRRDGRDTSTWGDAPVCTVIPVVQMLLDAVVQHVLAVQMLLERGGDVVLAIDAETRTRAAVRAILRNPKYTDRQRRHDVR